MDQLERVLSIASGNEQAMKHTAGAAEWTAQRTQVRLCGDSASRPACPAVCAAATSRRVAPQALILQQQGWVQPLDTKQRC